MKREGFGGFVAVHRWFADGEGWAYHPWFQEQMHELLSVLKNNLENRSNYCGENVSRGSKVFTCEAMGGYLVGRQDLDLTCPDPKAANRFPTILRVVFVPEKPSEEEARTMIDQLASFDVDLSGPNEVLFLAMKQIPQQANTRPRQMRFFRIFVLIAILATAAGVLVWQGFRERLGLHDKELSEAKKKMSDLIKGWRLDEGRHRLGSGDAFEVAEHFLRILSRGGIGRDLKGDHPDVHFFARLPEYTGERPRSKSELRKALEKLVAHLDKSKEQGAPEGHPSQLLVPMLDKIAEKMDYRVWWTESGKSLKYAMSGKPDEVVSELARKFVKESDNQKWQSDAAKEMLKHLTKWKVEAVTEWDAEHRPWFIFHCYFQFLSQIHFELGDLKDECYFKLFVKRLPEKPLTEDGMFVSEEDLINRLRKLAECLHAEKASVISTLLTNIAEKMNYPNWREKLDFRLDKEKGTENINRFVERFIN